MSDLPDQKKIDKWDKWNKLQFPGLYHGSFVEKKER